MGVYKDPKNGTWYFKCRVNGNHTTRRGFTTKKKAQKAEQELKGSIVCSTSFGEIANEYIHSLIKNKNSSAYSYESVYKKHIEKEFAKKRIDKVTIHDLKKLQDMMLHKKHSKGTYANRTINQVTSTFNSIMNYAVRYGYVDKNPCANFKTLKEVKNHDTLKFWTDTQFKNAIQYEDDFMWYCYLSLSYLTGMRKGEVRALRWTDIDFKRRSITITHHVNDKAQKTEKSEKIERLSEGRKNGGSHILAMDVNIYYLLEKLKGYDMNFDGWTPDSYLFGIFKPVGQYSPNRHLNMIAKKSGTPVITIHGLRHSHVSYLISKGLTPYEIANRIGDSVEMVLNVYGHMFPNPQQNIINNLSKDFDFKQASNERVVKNNVTARM